ncbi:M24 family metallopeptidase [Lutispora sp.]|nr:aminopeptidase P family protein [Lutispora sp.]MEA4962334.1 aminopeptidase P family protein [Lutispora sp.]
MRKSNYVQKFAAEADLDAALIYCPANRRYLSGFTGSAGYVLITPISKNFFSDFRYIEQAQGECNGYEIIPIKGEDDVLAYLKEKKIGKLGVERDFMTLRFADALRIISGVQILSGIDDQIVNLRMIKDDAELSRIRRACEITDLAFEHVITQIREGMTEAEIDLELQSYMRKFPEVERMAERFIVASGEHGSLPHGIAGARKVRNGDFITMDFGCNCGGYWSDVTRTVCLGKANAKQKEIYSIVHSAQQAAINMVRAGITGRQADKAARDVIEKAGYGKYFGHGLGHSFGLDIHEAPRFAQNTQGDITLKPGMTMTVEPGIYIPGWGGVRIEDDIIITENGCINLTGACKDLIEI